MPRKRPTPKLGIYGQSDINPENAVGSYLESKQQTKSFIKAPTWDISRDGLELYSIQNEREHAEMIKLQAEILENAKREKTINAKRVDEMYRIQNELRERFITVNDFIRDCEEKERVAEIKIDDEKKIHEKLQEEIDKYIHDIKELEDFQEVLSNTIEELEPYETVIKEVVQHSDTFKSVKDCMDQCDALMLAQVEISELEKNKIAEIEEMRKNMIKVTNDAALTILKLNNELTDMEKSYNNAKTESLKWEQVMSATKDCITENELTKNRILDAIQQMYKILCKRNGIDPVMDRNAIEGQLDYIKDEIEILQEVCKLCNQPEKKSPRIGFKSGKNKIKPQE